MKKLILVTALLLTVNAANASAVYDKYTGAVNVNGTVINPRMTQSIVYDSHSGVITAYYSNRRYDCNQGRYITTNYTKQVNASVADYKALIAAKSKPIVDRPVVQTQVTQEDTTPVYTEPTYNQTYTQQNTQTETSVLDNAVNTADTVINMINLFK